MQTLNARGTFVLRRSIHCRAFDARATLLLPASRPAISARILAPWTLSARLQSTLPQETDRTKSNADVPSLPAKPTRSLFSRFVSTSGEDPAKSASSFRAIVSLAKPEKKPLAMAIGLLFVSSSVSMSVPFTIGKLIDYFTSANPVRVYSARASKDEFSPNWHSQYHSACHLEKHLRRC